MTSSILITGACGGIGTALCQQFRKAGWTVIATDKKRSPDFDKTLEFIPLDFTEISSDSSILSTFCETVRQATDDAPLKAIINNAAAQILGETAAITANDMQQSFAVNVLAPFLLVQTFLPELEAANGSVLNIGTVHAQATKPEFVAYATTKTALHGLTRALAVDLGGRIRVNTLAPAAVATPMLVAGFEGRKDAYQDLKSVHPAGRIGEPGDVGKAALFLCSDEASFITGSTVYLDGGVLSRLHDPI